MKFLIPSILLLFLSACVSEKEESGSSELQIPVSKNSSLPYLTTGDDDRLYFSWVEKMDSGLVEFKYSRLEVNGWSDPKLIASGTDWFVNWADYPMIAIDSSGNMMAHYLAKSDSGTYSYDVNIVMKKAGQNNWSESVIPHNDGTPTEHGFVTMLPQSNGNFQISWLDGRNTADGSHGHGGGAMTIRTALMNMAGELTGETELDNRVCDCCQTTGANTSNGPVIMFRDRSEVEIRDVSIVRRTDQNWTSSVSVFEDNWNINGCPVNGPRADAFENTLALAWYSASNNQPEVKVVFSEDNGESFSAPIMIDESGPLGRVDIALIAANKALVTWLTSSNNKTLIKGMLVNIDGTKKEAFDIAETDENRGSGFPQVEVYENRAYFAWTSISENESTILHSVMELPKAQ